MASSISRRDGDRPRLIALYAGWLIPPLAWLIALESGYSVSYLPCRTGALWRTHAAVLAPLVLIGLSAWFVWRSRRPGQGDDLNSAAMIRLWLERGALLSCLWFALVILATEIPVLVVLPCLPPS